jgi:hypothetical protein
MARSDPQGFLDLVRQAERGLAYLRPHIPTTPKDRP